MKFEEFNELTVMRCYICEKELKSVVSAYRDKITWFCECENVSVIFKNDKTKELLYYSARMPNYAGQVIVSRPTSKHKFTITASSWNQNITFISDNIRIWLQDEHKIKSKLDSLMILK